MSIPVVGDELESQNVPGTLFWVLVVSFQTTFEESSWALCEEVDRVVLRMFVKSWLP